MKCNECGDTAKFWVEEVWAEDRMEAVEMCMTLCEECASEQAPAHIDQAHKRYHFTIEAIEEEFRS